MKTSPKSQNFEDLKGRFSVAYSDTQSVSRRNFHIHDAYEITLILSNGVHLEVNNESYAVPYGSLLIFNTMDLHRISHSGDDSYKRWVIWFKHDFLSEFGKSFYGMLRLFFARGTDRPNVLTLSPERIAVFTEICQRMKKASEEDSYMSTDLVRLTLGELLIRTNSWYMTDAPHISDVSGKDSSCVYDAILYIQENYSQKITRDTLARLTGVDEKTLCNRFKEITGQTTAQYVLSFRISAAKAYLIKGMPVTEVCEKTGFENWSNFSRTFRNHVGMSPKKYAMTHKDF